MKTEGNKGEIYIFLYWFDLSLKAKKTKVHFGFCSIVITLIFVKPNRIVL